MNLHRIVNRYNLDIANNFINDDVPTIAFEVDPNDDVFSLKLT